MTLDDDTLQYGIDDDPTGDIEKVAIGDARATRHTHIREEIKQAAAELSFRSPTSTSGESKATVALPNDLRHRIAEVYASDYVDVWWSTKQAKFGGSSPQELLAQGKRATIERALSRIEQGLPI